MTRTENILLAFQETAAPLLEFIQPRNSCIGQARITMETLRRLGVRAKPIASSLVLEIPEIEWAYIAGFTDSERAQIEARASRFLPHCNQDQTEKGWRGHLFVLAADKYLVDTSLDQASSPSHGVTIPPDVMIAPIGEYTPGRTVVELSCHLTTGQQIKITYWPKKDSSYQTSEAWKCCAEMGQLIDILVEKTRKSL